MDDVTSRALLADPETWRALQLDTLAAILPMERRDRIAELLTVDGVETLKHLAREGMGENTLRALASDLAYLEGWAKAATGEPLPWPAPEGLALKFVAHHLWDTARRQVDPQHGMPEYVAELFERPSYCASRGLMRRDAGWRVGARCIAGRGRRAIRDAGPTSCAASCCLGRSPAQRGRHGFALNKSSTSPTFLWILPAPLRQRRHASRSSLVEPKRRTWTMRARCYWSGRRSRLCANGSCDQTSIMARFFARSIVGARSRREL